MTPGTEFDARGLWPRFSHPGVGAFMSTRLGGVSQGPYASLNLRDGVGDDPAAVAANRATVERWIGLPGWRVDQVHGCAVHDLSVHGAPPASGMAPLAVADASICDQLGRACEIQTADCLPVLFAHRDGRIVGAAHAGWRGLAGGVLEACLQRLCERSGAPAAEFEAWLGPCIGPAAFEVGAEVLAAFGAAPARAEPGSAFASRPDRPGKWLADLPALARQRLQAAGVRDIGGNDGSADWCTHTQAARYFSFRRDGPQTGRLAAFIWRRPTRV
ncbi:MAG: peptidoglycan editing factor PgeF [Leptothrix sp. (in: b-proteobacteria)]